LKKIQLNEQEGQISILEEALTILSTEIISQKARQNLVTKFLCIELPVALRLALLTATQFQ
jgi:hypothetical protein